MTTTNTTRTRRRRMLTAALLSSTLLMTACGSSDDGDGAAAAPSKDSAAPAAADLVSFTGTVEGTDAYFAIQSSGGEQIAYVCDGEGIWSTYEGTLTDTGFTGTAVGGEETITATFAADAVTGTVTLEDGTSHALAGSRSTNGAGLYRLGTVLDDGAQLESWIRLADGTVRGKAVVATTSGEGAVTGEPASAGVPPAASNPVPTGLIKCIKAALKRRKATILNNSLGENDPGEAASGAAQIAADQAMMEACGGLS